MLKNFKYCRNIAHRLSTSISDIDYYISHPVNDSKETVASLHLPVMVETVTKLLKPANDKVSLYIFKSHCVSGFLQRKLL